MRNWRTSAAYRIAFAYFGVYAIGLALLGAIIFAVMQESLHRQLDSMISDEATTLVAEFRTGGKTELVEGVARRESSQSATRMLYALFAPDGRRIAGSFPAARPARTGFSDVTFRDPDEGPDLARGITVDLASGDRLVVAVDSDWLERIQQTVLIVFGAAFVGACLMGFAGALLLGNYLERRLRSIRSSAELIIGGDIRKRMPIGSDHDEFDRLAQTLNRMLDRIEGLLDNLRQVSSDIAHDLRTPLSRLRTRLEQGVLDVKSGAVDDVLEDAIHRVDDVLSLFGAILRIAEVESGETRRFFVPVDLGALVTELAESFAPSFEDEGRILLSSVEQKIEVEGDRELLAQAIINLLENAQRHTPAGSIIRVTLASANAWACVQVLDNGPGVPKADLARVTKRFARLDTARNAPGYGLGLSLVSAVAKLHHGRLTLRNMQPGLSATIELPRTLRASRKPTVSTSVEPAE